MKTGCSDCQGTRKAFAFHPTNFGFRFQIGDVRFSHRVGFEYLHRILSHPAGIDACTVRGNYSAGDLEGDRSTVTHGVKAAIASLIETPETEEIGLHLLDSVLTGKVCRYIGNREWSL